MQIYIRNTVTCFFFPDEMQKQVFWTLTSPENGFPNQSTVSLLEARASKHSNGRGHLCCTCQTLPSHPKTTHGCVAEEHSPQEACVKKLLEPFNSCPVQLGKSAQGMQSFYCKPTSFIKRWELNQQICTVPKALWLPRNLLSCSCLQAVKFNGILDQAWELTVLNSVQDVQ